MNIKEMEIQIDRLGLEKLEVRLKKGSEVDVFICAIKDDKEGELEDEEQHRGSIVIYDGHGKCWTTTQLVLWSKGGNYEITYSDGLYGEEFLSAINGCELKRDKERDLEDLSV